MKIETKFGVGDSVVFLQDGAVWRKTIIKLEVTVDRSLNPTDATPTLLIVYYFDEKDRYGQPLYKYETEVAATKAELIEISREMT